ncbi:MAG: uncharacterized protein A8A55_0803 [Amphiamblys sp. WSBS2006]|nr:MAG: uncharacterized protein A8A55_0803 [Amphiamblys sp. WSBS2006]
MQNISVLIATLSVCVCAFSSFAYIPKDVLPRFPTEQDGDIYFLTEREQPIALCSVYFRYAARDKTVQSPVSLLRFVYDETEAKTHYPNARDIPEEVARFIANHTEVDTERRLFFVSFADDVSPVQAVPKGIAEVSVLTVEENNIEYCYKKEREHGNIFDRFLITEECKGEEKKKTSRIKNIPAKKKEAILLLSFLAAKEFRLDLKAALFIHGEEGNKWGLKIPYGVSLFVSEENSCCLKIFDLTETKIKALIVSSFDITRMDLKNTYIEELFLVDEAALDFFYDSMEKPGLYVEKVSFVKKLNPKSEKFLKLIERVHGGETAAPRKIKALVLSRNNFFAFLKETRRISQRKIHVEDLIVAQTGKYAGPETETRIVVSKKIGIIGSACVLLFIEFGPELSHFNIDEIQRQCRSPGIDIPKINIQLTENKAIVRGNLHVLQFFKTNITATDVSFFAASEKKELETTKITLAVGELESICFGGRGLSVLSSITNEKIDVRHMEVMDIVDFSKEKPKKKEFVIRERLYMRNTGLFFLEFLENTAFIPVIEIEVDCHTMNLGVFRKTVSTRVGTNALVENNIDPKTKQKIGGIVKQKEVVVKTELGYQKVVFEEDLRHEEQRGTGESEEQPSTESQELCLKKRSKRYTCCYDFSNYTYGNYED